MLQDLTKFNTLYQHLLFLNQNNRTEEFIERYQENFGLIVRKYDDEDSDHSVLRKKLIIQAHYADKLYQTANYQEAEKETQEALNNFESLSNSERENTNLYQLMQYNLAKIAYKLKDFESSHARFIRLKKMYPERTEYLHWILLVNYKKRKNLKYLLVVLAGVSLAVGVSYLGKDKLLISLFGIILSVIFGLVLLVQEWRFKRTEKILHKKAPL